MSKKTPEQAAEIIRELTIKVKNGVLSSAEAEKAAILALQEVDEAQPEVKSEEAPVENTPVSDAPTTSPVDPKTRILSLLTRAGESIQVSLKSLEKDITDILKETAGAAVPLGDFSIGSGASQSQHLFSAKLTIEAGEKPAQAMISYLLKKDWTVEGIQLPVTAGVVRACNLPLRQEMLEVCSEIREHTANELVWKKGKRLPLEHVSRLETVAKETGDYRVKEILEGKPSDALAESWKKWAIASQVYLLGSDFSECKGFTSVKQSI